MNHSDWANLDKKFIWHPCSQMKDYETLAPIVIERAEGLKLYDIDGKCYFDVVSSWWCNLLGHNNPKINQKIEQQLGKLEHVIFANFSHKPAIELCQKLIKIMPKGLVKFNFHDNGSGAIEAAMKMSFQYHHQTGHPERIRFMALADAYHGETLGALSVGGVDLYSELYKPILLDICRIEGMDCYRCPFGKTRDCCQAECISSAEKTFEKYGHETAALLVEPLLQGAGGMKIYPPIYLKKLRELCDKYGVHLIADEIATGFGRTGSMFACDQAGISPDIMCISKGLTGGYLPMSIAVTTQEIYDAFYADYSEGKAFMHSHTYAGNPLACAAALAVQDILENDGILETARQNAPYFHQLLVDAIGNHPNVGEIRHIGLINAIELVANRETKTPFPSKLRIGYQIYKKALNQGLLLRPLGDVLYFNPPLIITREEMRLCVEILKNLLAELK